MRSAYDVMQDSVQSWTVGYGEYQFPIYTIEGGGPKFLEFIEWLKRTPYKEYKEYTYEPVKSVEEPKDEGISW